MSDWDLAVYKETLLRILDVTQRWRNCDADDYVDGDDAMEEIEGLVDEVGLE